jgi:WD40 repeat protein
MKRISVLLPFLVSSLLAYGQGTRLWKESSYDEFELGTAKGVAINSRGKLELAPAFKTLYTSPSTFIWSIASDKDGAVYAATGAPARVYRITADGKGAAIFEPKELQVQAIAMGSDGAVYAATSPDGKVYKLTRKKTATGVGAEFASEVFFDPGTKYIWDMEFDSQGRLYLATGDRGEIYRVEKNGQGSVFFKSDEAHIRVLAFDPKGNLIAGSDGSGLIYRITPSGEGFVLYSAPKKEITALAVDASGNIFASGTGEKRPSPPGGVPAAPAAPTNPAPQQPVAPGTAPLPPNVNLTGSDVYMIAPDGSPRKLWSSHDDIVYALAFNGAGQLIAGTGNKGRIYSISSNGEYVDLLKGSANQITAFAKTATGGLYCSSSNLGKIFEMRDAPEGEGTFESDVQDAHIFSHWGRAEVRARGNYELFARSGNVDNPDRNWSPWTRVDVSKSSRLDVPDARFVQWRVILKPAVPVTQVEEVGINYLSRNVAPVVEEVGVQAGARFNAQPHLSGSEPVTVGFGSNPAPQSHFENPPSAIRDRAYIAVRWAAHDDNDDNLDYSLFYRGENERDWKLLKSGITDKFYSFESNLLPDGVYVMKVVASDAPSHTPQDALTDQKESLRFVVDNTPPRIQNLAARIEGQQIHVTFLATDDISNIQWAEYSIDAGEWQYLEPVGQISDSKTENYDFNALLNAPEQSLDEQVQQKRAHGGKKSSPPVVEHVVVVKVVDRYDNEVTAKYVIR